MKKISKITISVVLSLLLFLGILCYNSANWYLGVYGDLGFDAILYTLFSAMDNVESGLIENYIQIVLVPSVIISTVLSVFLFFSSKRRLVLNIGRCFWLRFYPLHRIVSVLVSLAITVTLMFTAATDVGLAAYIKNTLATRTTFIEENYVKPTQDNVKFPAQKQNLIYIYLESMETTFLSTDLGGGNDVNPIPELYALAEENVNFSHNSAVGGFEALSGSNWTVGAMVSATAGVPLKTPFGIQGNSYGQDQFMPGITSLSDVLHENGYYQALMVGSDAGFGGRKQYYEQHGTDKIYDLFTARQDGIVPEDYYVWWGMEDARLFEYAKQELTKIAQNEQPFAFTMLTADTHHIGGYVCGDCSNDYAQQYENVLACSSKRVYAFIQWIQQQDFYENTTIILAGDHPTMDGEFIETNIAEGYERKVYNCFINAKAQTDHTKNRQFGPFDMFPTTLAALGCTIEGDRLGLGTNLFSEKPTLCEQLGTGQFNMEVARNSSFYNREFLNIFM